MAKKILIFSFLFGILFNFKCTNTKFSEENEYILEIIKEYKFGIINQRSIIVLIPLDGCSSCNNSMIEFLKKYSDRKNIFYIINSSYNKKVQNHFGENIFNQYNIIFDKKNLIYQAPSFINGSVVYFLNYKNRIIKIVVPAHEQDIKGLMNEMLQYIQ
jgi:hypothetical protein